MADKPSQYPKGTVGRLVEEMGEREAYTFIVAESVGARMLLAEARDVLRDVLADYLEDRGYQMSAARNIQVVNCWGAIDEFLSGSTDDRDS